jgi:phenylacetate-CoA ligase
VIAQLEKIYRKSPAFFQNLMVTGYGYKIYRREYGGQFRAILKEFEEMERWSEAQLREYQNQKLRDLIRHSFENVPYYRSQMDAIKLRPEDIKTVDDLPKMPLLTKSDIRTHFEQLKARNYKPSELIVGRSSGTTGSPLHFVWDKHICLVKNVVDWRQKKWAGIEVGDKIAFFLGRVVVPVTQTKPPFWRTNYILNHTYFSNIHISEENLKLYLKQLEKFGPKAVEGYPSTVHLISRYMVQKGITFPVTAVLTSSETLFPQQRETIEKAFACKVFDFYGMAERTVFATECSLHSGHHLNMDFGITEIIDDNGRAAGPGEMGRVTATGLHNYAMPLIRYQTSDVSAIKTSKCKCGRNFPLLEDVMSRVEDFIVTRDGKFINPNVLSHPFKPMNYIVESQIIQEDYENLTIKIVPLPGYSEKDTKFLHDELSRRIGDSIKINFVFVDSIPRTKAGKLKWVISKIPQRIV